MSYNHKGTNGQQRRKILGFQKDSRRVGEGLLQELHLLRVNGSENSFLNSGLAAYLPKAHTSKSKGQDKGKMLLQKSWQSGEKMGLMRPKPALKIVLSLTAFKAENGGRPFGDSSRQGLVLNPSPLCGQRLTLSSDII